MNNHSKLAGLRLEYKTLHFQCRLSFSFIVHSQPVGKGQAALKYLATYIFRPAISNGRLLSLENGIVSFRYQCSQTGHWKICRLEAIEFIRRFLQHMLPRGFSKSGTTGCMATATGSSSACFARNLTNLPVIRHPYRNPPCRSKPHHPSRRYQPTPHVVAAGGRCSW